MLKVDYTTLFISTTKNNEGYSRVEYNEDSSGKPWIVDRVADQVQLYSDKRLTLQFRDNPATSTINMGLLGRWPGRRISE